MKKQKHLPDFTILCRPEQNTIQNILSLMIFFFFTGSVCGYVWEVLIFLLKEGTFRNRGFLYGPWLPVYGIGAVLFSVVLSPRELLPDSSGKYKKNHPVTVFFLSTLLGSGLELVIGWFLDFFWNLRYWDYSGYFLDFRGYICLVSALGFGIAGVLWVCIFSKILQKWWYHISLDFRKNGICFGFSFLLLTALPHLFFQIPDIVLPFKDYLASPPSKYSASSFMTCGSFSLKIIPNIARTSGPAKKICQKNAIGKFKAVV